MKKAFLKPALWLITIMFISPMFLASSCNNDDDDDPIVTNPTTSYKDLIVGSWGTYMIASVEYYDRVITSADTILTPIGSANYNILTFTSDGKLLDSTGFEHASYNIIDDMIHLYFIEGYASLEIKTLNQNKFTFYIEEPRNTEEGHTFRITSTQFFDKITTPTKIAKK